MHRIAHLLGVTAMAGLALSPLASQCALQWQPGDPIPYAHGNVNASTLWDPDGAGPAPALLVVGGRFGAGAMPLTSLATFDGTSWGALGTPPIPNVTALTTWNGLLAAAGGTGTQHVVATWNGTIWSVIGSATGAINALAVFNGALFAGGLFSQMNGQLVHNLVQWNGTTWSEPGGGVTGEVATMAVFGSLHVGGFLSQAGTLTVFHHAIWNGTSWSAGGSFNARVQCLAARNGSTAANSFLFAGGDFSTVSGVAASSVARFTSSTNAWTALPGLPSTTCTALHVRNTGLTTFQLHAGGQDSSALAAAWRLNGTTWQPLGSVFTGPVLSSLAFFNGQYVATFKAYANSSDTPGQTVQIHDGTAWLPAAGPGFDGAILTVTSRGGELVVGGEFQRYGTTSLQNIARGSPGAWQPLGTGVSGGIFGNGVYSLCTMANGDVVAGGSFATAGGVAANNIARWDGASWSPLGAGVTGPVFALLALPDGGLIAAGSFVQAGGVAAHNIARWDGTSWSLLGLGTNDAVWALARRSNGDILAAGDFLAAGGAPAQRIASWNGASWSPLDTGLDDRVLAVAVLTDDSVVAGGFFAQAGSVFRPWIARWDGNAWFAQSTSTTAWDTAVATIVPLPNGDYVAGGVTSFFGLGGPFGGVDANVARHTGDTSSLAWAPLDLRGFMVTSSTMTPAGDLVFAGGFDGAGGLASHSVAVLRPSCPASAISYGSGCAGSGGANALAATALPWTGGTFRARATGMPTIAIAIVVTGFSQLALPMPNLLPQGVAGCTLLVSPDLLDPTLPSAGVVTTQIAIPATPSLVGQSFHQQVVPLETDLAGNILAITSTNGLTLTIGVL